MIKCLLYILPAGHMQKKKTTNNDKTIAALNFLCLFVCFADRAINLNQEAVAPISKSLEVRGSLSQNNVSSYLT